MGELSKSQIVIDASFFLKLLLPENKSNKAEKLWKNWIEDSVEVVAPTLIIFEVTSVLKNKVWRGILENNDAAEIIDQIKHFEITFIYTEEILDVAWEVGSVLKTPTLYDCFYLALSKFLVIPLWTADKKLYNSAKRKFPFIHLL